MSQLLYAEILCRKPVRREPFLMHLALEDPAFLVGHEPQQSREPRDTIHVRQSDRDTEAVAQFVCRAEIGRRDRFRLRIG